MKENGFFTKKMKIFFMYLKKKKEKNLKKSVEFNFQVECNRKLTRPV